MRREATATGKTVDAAIEAACQELGLARENVEIEVLELPKKGFLGLSHTPAKVKVWTQASKAQLAESYIADVVKAMGLDDITVTLTEEDGTAYLHLEGDVGGVAIGRRGETLDALQYLAGLSANRSEGEYMRVVLDSGNYREKRKQTLEQLAKKLAATAIRTGRSTTLEPMNPYERRIIHAAIAQIEGVTSTSVGEEPSRCVVVSSTSPRPQRPQGERPPRRENGGRPASRFNGDRGGEIKEGARSQKPQGRGPRRDDRGPRREKPAPYQATTIREEAPAEAADKPLYGKIEL